MPQTLTVDGHRIVETLRTDLAWYEMQCEAAMEAGDMRLAADHGTAYHETATAILLVTGIDPRPSV